MDATSLQRFGHILLKEINKLTQEEISFIRARQDYLNPIQKNFYAPILNNNEETKEVAQEPKKRIVSRKKVTN